MSSTSVSAKIPVQAYLWNVALPHAYDLLEVIPFLLAKNLCSNWSQVRGSPKIIVVEPCSCTIVLTPTRYHFSVQTPCKLRTQRQSRDSKTFSTVPSKTTKLPTTRTTPAAPANWSWPCRSSVRRPRGRSSTSAASNRTAVCPCTNCSSNFWRPKPDCLRTDPPSAQGGLRRFGGNGKAWHHEFVHVSFGCKGFWMPRSLLLRQAGRDISWGAPFKPPNELWTTQFNLASPKSRTLSSLPSATLNQARWPAFEVWQQVGRATWAQKKLPSTDKHRYMPNVELLLSKDHLILEDPRGLISPISKPVNLHSSAFRVSRLIRFVSLSSRLFPTRLARVRWGKVLPKSKDSRRWTIPAYVHTNVTWPVTHSPNPASSPRVVCPKNIYIYLFTPFTHRQFKRCNQLVRISLNNNQPLGLKRNFSGRETLTWWYIRRK